MTSAKVTAIQSKSSTQSQTQTKILFAGAGSLAAIALTHMKHLDIDAYAIARSDKRRWKKQPGIREFWQGDLRDKAILAKIAELQPDAVVVTLVPDGAGEEGYRRGYLEPLVALVNCLVESSPKTALLFASSTGVYHQTAGETVDEASPVHPTSYSGQVMLEAEDLLANSGLMTCAMRFGGIYGPGRDYLIHQVQAGQGGNDEFTNRIHEQDAGRAITFLLERLTQNKSLPKTLIVCDSDPAPSNAVRRYIAEQLGIDPQTLVASESGRGGNKRCDNHLLLQLGFKLRYESYREGYRMNKQV